MEPVLAHLVGDYVLQSEWMANTKTQRSFAAVCHALIYTLPFLLITRSPSALAFICVTHFVIDRWRLARYVTYASNLLAPRHSWPDHHIWDTKTGYDDSKPPFLAVWLLIIVDNTMHLACNWWAITTFG